MIKSVAVIGLGLIGGSIAKSIKKNTNIVVIGADRNQAVEAAAVESAAVDRLWNRSKEIDADVVIIALSPSSTKSFLQQNILQFKKNTIITDVCGVKRSIIDEIEPVCIEAGLKFVGGHPMAGKEVSGFENSSDNLFCNATYILTKTTNSDDYAISCLKELAKILGCKNVTITTPEQHDAMIAFTSQLPHVVAGAYVKSTKNSNHSGFSAGSYQDISRVACVNENLWAELFLSNSDKLCQEIDTLIQHLKEYRTAIDLGKREDICEVIKRGRQIKEKDFKQLETNPELS